MKLTSLSRFSVAMCALLLFLTALPTQAANSYSPAPSLTVETEENTSKVTFRYKDSKAKQVYVAGSFNNWDATGNEMKKSGDTFVATIDLPEGEHQYKFVLEGNTWIADPENGKTADDNYGGKNSVVSVSKLAAEQEAKRKELRKRLAAATQGDSPLTSSLGITTIGRGRSRVSFHYYAPGAEQVYVAGSFNGWAGDKDPMQKKGDVFTWTTELADGEYMYKFVVNGTEWNKDPLNPQSSDDGHGGENSIFVLGDGAKITTSNEKVGDDKLNEAGLFHDPEAIEYFNPHADGSVILKLRTLANDMSGGRLKYRLNDGDPGRSDEITPSVFKDEKFEYFKTRVGEIPMTGTAPSSRANVAGGKLEYLFELRDDGSKESTGTMPSRQIATMAFGADGVSTDVNTAKPFTREWKAEDVFVTPQWARSVVWYEIFPERFRNGSKENDVPNVREWTSEWTRRGTDEKQGLYPGIFGRRYGGDIQGCIEKLDYLKTLGVGAIWFNPVFESQSLHKYDATDYRHIDEQFGFKGDYKKITAGEDLLDPKTWKFSDSDKLFLDFVKKAHVAGIKVILDGVFNHTGTAHPAFQDVKQHGEKSRFKNWYNVNSFAPFEWEGWFGVKDLPVFKEDANGFTDPTLDAHIMAVTKRWMDPNGDGDPSDGIDGWRLDVANEVSSKFWVRWRDHVKSINPEAIIMGEIWDPPAKYLRGDQFDCVMNYMHAKALIKYMADGGKPSVYASELLQHFNSVPDQANFVMMNLMNSHDTDRLASMLYNPGRQYDQKNRLQDLKPGEYNYKSEKPTTDTYTRMKALLPLQFAYVGSPMIYYGDEVGMWGADDPDDRKPMLWEDLQPYENSESNFVMKDLFAAFQRVAAIRNSFRALNEGELEFLVTNDASGVVAIRRSVKGAEDVIIVANNSDKPADVEINFGENAPKTYVDVLQEAGARIIPAPASSHQRTRVEIQKGAATITATNGKVTIQLKPVSSTMLVSR